MAETIHERMQGGIRFLPAEPAQPKSVPDNTIARARKIAQALTPYDERWALLVVMESARITDNPDQILAIAQAYLADNPEPPPDVAEKLGICGGPDAGEEMSAVSAELLPTRDDSEYDADQLAAGQRVEMEHTADPDAARQIAKHHLDEDPDYYRKLARYVENED